jgi:hypothetical protein
MNGIVKSTGDTNTMRAKLSLLLFLSSLVSVALNAQESLPPNAVIRDREALAVRSQQPTEPRIVDPSQLKQVGHGSLNNILGVQTDLGLPAAAGPIGFAGPALPVWSYTSGGLTGSIVGTAPATQASTTIPTVVIPVILRITQGGTTFVFDPTAPDDGCLGVGNTGLSLTQQGPLFNNASFTLNGVNVGNTQFIDAFQRGEFWSTVNNGGYHVLLSQSLGAALTISVNAGNTGSSTAAVFGLGGVQCGTNAGTTNRHAMLGVININTVDAQLRAYITAHGLNAGQFPFFVLYSSVISNGAANNLNNCCILGYHSATGAPGQSYGISEFEGHNQTVFTGVADTSVEAHEIGEWANDPFGNNPTPAWGGIGQVAGCQGNFEVGDPLSGKLQPTVLMPNGFTYHLQELAFFSWFYHDAPSQGVGGKYSSNGTFAGFAKACPPGGTN